MSVLIILSIAFAVYLLIQRASVLVWTISYFIFALLYTRYGEPSLFATSFLWLTFAVFLLCSVKPLRCRLLTSFILKRMNHAMPHMSDTERQALEAGTVSFEGELFSGHPDFHSLLNTKPSTLTQEEKDFLSGPVDELCRMLNDWEITHEHTDLPAEVWQFIKEKGFLGMIIPKTYGGLEFSATCQMMVLSKLYGHSVTAATTVAVPNSLGPAELLLKYGTEAQKNYYLPRLARGEEIPCFALTGPNAGSDAASIPDVGTVCREMIDGKEQIAIRLNWNKRYITLCPVATVIGLAFRLYDPDNILGKGVDVGITCALIPTKTKGVTTGRRHFPLNTAFLNGPTQGKDVLITEDMLIGGPALAGSGWRMLMECLSAGRAISLPSSANGATQALALGSGAYARVRRQFNQSIGQFEGIEEPLARIAANAYIIDAALSMTACAIDRGAHPAVAGAILKYHTTERSRQSVIDAMDIHGGKGICLGPNNYLGRGYQSAPIAITVEGANILTRSLIIFGQGAIRCHPYIFKEMQAIQHNDLKAFDLAFWGHVAFVLSNFSKSLIFGWTRALWTTAPVSRMKREYQYAHLFSANLAFLSDFCMITLGASLKRREKLSARLGDLLSKLYLLSAVLKRYHDEGEPAVDLPLVRFCAQTLLYESEAALRTVIANFPIRPLRWVLRFILMPLASTCHKPSDKLGERVAHLLTEPNETRSRLTHLVFCEPIPNSPLGRLEAAFMQITAVAALEQTVSKAYKKGLITGLTMLEQIKDAEAKALINKDEALLLYSAEQARQAVIAVDDFDDAELRRSKAKSKAKKQLLVETS